MASRAVPNLILRAAPGRFMLADAIFKWISLLKISTATNGPTGVTDDSFAEG